MCEEAKRKTVVARGRDEKDSTRPFHVVNRALAGR